MKLPLIIGATFVALIIAAGGAGVLISRDDGESVSPVTAAPVSPTTAPSPNAATQSLYAWSGAQGTWQSDQATTHVTDGGTAVILFNIRGGAGSTRDVSFSFRCDSPIAISLVPFIDAGRAPEELIVQPGPGRVRPDSVIFNESMAAWGATFLDAPTWSQPSTECLSGQALNFRLAIQSDSASVAFNARFDSEGQEPANVTTTAAIADIGESQITISVSSP